MKDYLRTIALKSVSNIYNTQKLPHNQHELYGSFLYETKSAASSVNLLLRRFMGFYSFSTDPELHTAEPHRAHSDAVWT
mgnify:CR=1 FL=1